uniref:TIGR03663 family protein n=1 Tax=Geoglobus ahangari TaxID=113653 RepID=A0A7C3YL64_9EURY
MTVKRAYITFGVAIIAIILRFYDLGKAPLFFDESVHTAFVESVLKGNYYYNPAFHGPLLFYMAAGVISILGRSEFAYRFVPAIFGVLTVLLTLKFERFIGKGAYYAALFLAVSPIIVNYSRFFRNESQILFFTLSFVYFIFRYFEERKTIYLVLSSISLSLFACSKENFYPIAFLMLLFFIFDIKKFRIKDVAISCVTFFLIYSALYTNFFTDLSYITQIDKFPAVQALRYWEHQHEIARIGGPLWYYFPLLLLYDLPVFMLGIYTIAKWTHKRDLDNFKAFLIYWLLVNLLFYSYVQEKVPWLVVHIELPLYLIAGYGLSEIKKFRNLILAVSFVFLLYSSINLNIINPTNPAEPALYLPTSMDVKEFRKELKEMNVSRVCVIMSAGDYWPLPCYLEDFKTYYFTRIKNDNELKRIISSYECQVVILNSTNARLASLDYEKREICLRSWVSYDVTPPNVLEFLIFRKPMGTVVYFNHTVYFLCGG